MTYLILFSNAQMARISPLFLLSHGMPRVDDRRGISGNIFVIHNGLRRRDVPASYWPYKTIYNRFIHWSEMGVFGWILVEPAKGCQYTKEIMIGATQLKAHRTAASLLKKCMLRVNERSKRHKYVTGPICKKEGHTRTPTIRQKIIIVLISP